MDQLWSGDIEGELPKTESKNDIRAASGVSQVEINRFMLTMLVQQIAPNIHYWDRSSLFSVDKLRRDVGWEPELTFPASVERTWRWYQSAGLPDSQEFDFSFEDGLIKMARGWKD